jgi:hypothetical protein
VNDLAIAKNDQRGAFAFFIGYQPLSGDFQALDEAFAQFHRFRGHDIEIGIGSTLRFHKSPCSTYHRAQQGEMDRRSCRQKSIGRPTAYIDGRSFEGHGRIGE